MKFLLAVQWVCKIILVTVTVAVYGLAGYALWTLVKPWLHALTAG